MNKAFITGATGFVGQHLKSHLQDIGWEVKSSKVDLRSYEDLRNKLDRYRPTHIFHLAAQAYVTESFLNPQRTFEVNTIGSLNLLEAVRQLGLKTKILLAGTSEEYGGGEVSEESKMEPLSPYAISKLAMDHLGQLYAKSYGMQIVVTRAFNHTGPGRGEMYAESAFAKQIVEIEQGKRTILEHGNLNSVRNYSDVRDIVRAYRLAIDLTPDVYNICSDQNVTIRDVLIILISLANTKVSYQENEALRRPVDFNFKSPSCEKFKELTGWKPEYDLETTLRDLLEHWRGQLV